MQVGKTEDAGKNLMVLSVDNDIPAARLSAKGYGSSKPCVPNDSKENMAKNRRTEFKIMQ